MGEVTEVKQGRQTSQGPSRARLERRTGNDVIPSYSFEAEDCTEDVH